VEAHRLQVSQGIVEPDVTSSRSLNGSKVLPFDVLKETYSEVLRNVPDVSLV